MNMKLSEIKSIKEAMSETEVNTYLADGYVIIKIVLAKSIGVNGAEQARPLYILGSDKKQ